MQEDLARNRILTFFLRARTIENILNRDHHIKTADTMSKRN